VPVFQALLGAFIVGPTWRLARHAIGPTVAAGAAWLTACWPLLIEFTTILASELLFIALVLTSLNIWISRRLPFAVRMISFGASIAAATYVRPTALLLLFIFLVMQWIVDRDWRAFAMGSLLAVLTASLLFAPWAYRSVVLFDRFVLVSANGGVHLWMGNNPESTDGYMDLPDKKFPNEVDRDHYYGREAVNFILSHPLASARIREVVGQAGNNDVRPRNDRRRLERKRTRLQIQRHINGDAEAYIERLLVDTSGFGIGRHRARHTPAAYKAAVAAAGGFLLFRGFSDSYGGNGSLSRTGRSDVGHLRRVRAAWETISRSATLRIRAVPRREQIAVPPLPLSNSRARRWDKISNRYYGGAIYIA
jgi:hypothetical protein